MLRDVMRETSSEIVKQEYETFMTTIPCRGCKGKRLKPEALAVTVGDKNISELTELLSVNWLSLWIR